MGVQTEDIASDLDDDGVGRALRAVQGEPRLTTGMRLAEHLRWTAARSHTPVRDAVALVQAVRTTDDLTAIAALHALSAVAHPSADDLLLETVLDRSALAAHAAWAFGARRSSPAAVDALTSLAVEGGFTAMLAERTLDRWSRSDPAGSSSSTHLDRADLDGADGVDWIRDDGMVVVQPFLHARLDRDGTSLGAGDAGGIASLLRSLGASLAATDGVGGVVTITRRHEGESGSESIAPRHHVHRIEVGPRGPLPWREGWRFRRSIEEQLVVFGRSLAPRRVVWHLRMADVGTLAAAAAARRLGHPVVFTAAPDPHVVIDAMQDSGRIDRSNFGLEDASAQFWFRARMVERLSSQADHLTLLPRPTIERELIELVGLEPIDLATRATIIPEGVDVGALDHARSTVELAGVPLSVRRVLDRLHPVRRDLPWLLTVGRLHPSKGPQRIVEAVCSAPDLARGVNIVVVGGDLDRPSPDERSTVERIRLAARSADPGLVTLTGHLPPAEVTELMAYLAASNGVYVCASDKEEFGLAVVEALGSGAVVVAPERGGPRTYVEHGRTGMLCDTQSIAALHAAIRGAMDLTVRPGRAEAGRAMVRQDLSVERMAERLARVYRRVCPATAPTLPLSVPRQVTS